MQYKWVALTVTTVGTLMAGIDTRIVIVGLPTISRELGADVEQVIWVTQAYLLASTIGLLLIGRVTDVVGRVKIYNVGFIIFTIGSALASVSFSPYELIASRIVQGVGSSMLVTNSTAILTDATPRKELGTILGMNQIAFRIGSIAGLTLSGLIIALADWRALFYINIPIGIFGTLWAHKRLKEISTKDTARGMDWSGFTLFSVGLTMILLAITFLSYGGSDYSMGAGLFASGALLLGVFIRVETRLKKKKGGTAPLLDLKLFRIREFAAGNLAQMMNSLAFAGTVIMLSFFLQIVLNESALSTGLSLLPLEGAYVILGPISGKLSDRYGARLFSTLGLSIGSAGFFILSTVSSSTPYVELALVLALLGTGNGMFVSPNVSSIMGSVPANRRGIASGFRVTTFNVGITASAGIAILFITILIPYSTFSLLLEGTLPSVGVLLARDQFLAGFKLASLIFAFINCAAMVPSAMRGKRATAPSSGGSGTAQQQQEQDDDEAQEKGEREQQRIE